MHFLEKYAGDIAEWHVPEGGFYIWVTFHKAFAVQTFFTRALEAGVLINPGALYLPEDRQILFVRILAGLGKRHSNDSGHRPPFHFVVQGITSRWLRALLRM